MMHEITLAGLTLTREDWASFDTDARREIIGVFFDDPGHSNCSVELPWEDAVTTLRRAQL